ncbi:MAG: hypothetical protein JOZ46_02285 [Candidatus Dormibacteraeota bacterium]|nr:hypothetical protein [Candidatus Dormibacteraeota bacterium]MBV9524625.1 hypothetical protein [Candidatus Dormibacteraeota bacterium]
MPWVLLVRWVVRLALALAFWRVGTARRAAGVPGAPPLRRPPGAPRIDPRAAAAAVREGASLGWRTLSAAAFLAAAIVLLTAGVTTTVLSPRWLGGLLLGLAVASVGVSALELRSAVLLLAARRRRRHDRELRSSLS